MTLRARPVARRRGRAGWDSGDRRNSLINAGFFLAIGISVLLLVGYAAWSWYDDHFGAAATVNGQVITKDHLRNRLAIESFRLNYVEQRIYTLLAQGRMSSADAQAQIDFLNQRRTQLAGLTLDRLVDVALMATLATENGVQVTEAEVDEQITEESTTSEQRHVWMIEVEPATDPDTGQVGDAQKRVALVRAQQALGRLAKGESWEDVARTVSDSGIAPQAGDLGWLSKDSGYDESFMEAVFAADLNDPTGVITGEDDVYRIGRVTEMAEAKVDGDFAAQLQDAEIELADYRAAARADVLREHLSDKVVADMSKPAVQRQVLEIYLPEPNQSTAGNEPGVKVRWMVFAPKDSLVEAPDLPETDPAWAKAKADADAMHARLKANPTIFDTLARTSSDESTGKANGGKQRWIYASTPIDQFVKSAVLTTGLLPGQLLDPVKGELGWYVIQLLRSNDDDETAWLDVRQDQDRHGHRGIPAGRSRQQRGPRGEQGRRHRLDRHGPAGRRARRGGLRHGRWPDVERHHHLRRRGPPVLDRQGGDADAHRGAAPDLRGQRVPVLVHEEEDRRQHRLPPRNHVDDRLAA